MNRPADERAPAPLADDLRRLDVRNALWKLRRHVSAGGDVECLRRLLPGAGATQARVEELLAEVATSETLRAGLVAPAVERWNAASASPVDPGDLPGHLGLRGTGRGRLVLLYAATRLLQPEVVIETGCFTGRDSAVLLQALELNGHGRLYTIDLPAEIGRFSQTAPGQGLPEGVETGFLVPPALRGRWQLTLGDARDELPPLLREVGEVGLFFHDSHHSYSHMMWEYTSVWPRLALHGLVVSDDIAWNTAFPDFAAGVGRPVVIHRASPNVGALSRGGTA